MLVLAGRAVRASASAEFQLASMEAWLSSVMASPVARGVAGGESDAGSTHRILKEGADALDGDYSCPPCSFRRSLKEVCSGQEVRLPVSQTETWRVLNGRRSQCSQRSARTSPATRAIKVELGGPHIAERS